MTFTDSLPEQKRDLRFFPVSNQVPRLLTPIQIVQFNEQGYISPLDLFSDEETVAQRCYFEKLLSKAAKLGLDSYAINGWHPTCRGLYDLVCHPLLLDYVQDIIGPNIISTMTHLFSKNPTDKKSVYWHQDAQFWPLTPSKIVTVWIAIDEVSETNGAMILWPTTHRRGIIPFQYVTDDEDGVLEEHVHYPERFGPSVRIELQAGQFSLHTDMLLHGSLPNNSGLRRAGLTIRYMSPDVRRSDEREPVAVIARGVDSSGYWKPLARPDGEEILPVLEEKARFQAAESSQNLTTG